MTKIIIATLILLTFPIFSRADGGVLEGVSIGANASIDTQIDASLSTSSGSVDTAVKTDSQSDDISATNTTETEVEGDGFFRRVINWFKGLFGFN